MDPAVRSAATSLAADPTFPTRPRAELVAEASALLDAKGEDGDDPLLVEMTLEHAAKLVKRKKRSLLRRLKDVLTLYDRDLVEIMGAISRPTVNAYIQGRIPEHFDRTDRRNLRELIDQRISELQLLRAEIS